MLKFVIKNRNRIFFLQCLLVHLSYAIFMGCMGISSLAIVNTVSSLIYILLVLIMGKNTELGLAIAYFEILVYAMFCELTLGNGFGFYLFSLGMAASLFFLIPSFGKKRFIYQVLGVVVMLGVEIAIRLWHWTIPFDTSNITDIKQNIFIVNLAITLVLVVEMGVLYATENDEIRAKLKHNMNHDPLTDLYNRRFFGESVRSRKAVSEQNYVIAMIDIDDFKKINDTYGHDIGDEAIVKVTTEIKKLVDNQNAMLKPSQLKEESTIPVRWGGEEFIVFFPYKNLNEVVSIMEEFRCVINRTIVRDRDNDISLSVTIGIAAGKSGSNCDSVINHADKNLYDGKRSGKNCIIAV